MFKQIFKENLALKILSLCLAILLELYLYSPDNSTSVSFAVPIEVKGLSPLMMIVEPRNAMEGLTAQLSVQGPSPLVEQVKASNKKFILDLKRSANSEQILPLDTNQLNLPAGVRPRVEPTKVHLRLERVMRKELPVTVEKIGTPKQGFTVRSVDIIPPMIVAHGPSSELEGISAISAEPIDLTNLSDTKTFEVSVSSQGTLTNYDVNFVTVRANITPVDIEKELSDVSVTVLAPPGFAASAEPSKITLHLAGPVNMLENIERSEVQVTADARGRANGTRKVRPTITLPAGVRVVSTDPEEITVTLVTSRG